MEPKDYAEEVIEFPNHYLGVSKNKGIPKWMVYNGNQN